LVELCGGEELRELLEQLARDGAAPVRRVAAAALGQEP
jgi:hypothetical protein